MAAEHKTINTTIGKHRPMAAPVQKAQNGFNYEDVLPAVQEAVSRAAR